MRRYQSPLGDGLAGDVISNIRRSGRSEFNQGLLELADIEELKID